MKYTVRCTHVVDIEVEADDPEHAKRKCADLGIEIPPYAAQSMQLVGSGDLSVGDAVEAGAPTREWMDWQKGGAVIHDERLYEAEMRDGSTKIVRGVVVSAGEADLVPEDDDSTSVAAGVIRLRLVD